MREMLPWELTPPVSQKSCTADTACMTFVHFSRQLSQCGRTEGQQRRRPNIWPLKDQSLRSFTATTDATGWNLRPPSTVAIMRKSKPMRQSIIFPTETGYSFVTLTLTSCSKVHDAIKHKLEQCVKESRGRRFIPHTYCKP